MPFTETLTPAQIKTIWVRMVDEQLAPAGPVSLSKADMRAAVEGVQQFLWDNRVALNTAVPQPARAAMTTDHKVAMLGYITAAHLEG